MALRTKTWATMEMLESYQIQLKASLSLTDTPEEPMWVKAKRLVSRPKTTLIFKDRLLTRATLITLAKRYKSANLETL